MRGHSSFFSIWLPGRTKCPNYLWNKILCRLYNTSRQACHRHFSLPLLKSHFLLAHGKSILGPVNILSEARLLTDIGKAIKLNVPDKQY